MGMTTEIVEKQKSSAIQFEIAELIKSRKSTRAFLTTAIEPEKIQSLFEAARWSASSMNEQPWHYLYVTRDQTSLWEKFFNILNDGNKVWVENVPLLIFSVSRKSFKRFNAPNAYALYDLGAANTSIALQAVALGLQVRQMAGYDHDKARQVLNIPDEFDLGVMLAVGYPAPADALPEPVRAKELAARERYVQEAFIKNGIF